MSQPVWCKINIIYFLSETWLNGYALHEHRRSGRPIENYWENRESRIGNPIG